MTTPATPDPSPRRAGDPAADRGARRLPAAAVVVGAVLLQALLVLAFVVPGHDPQPHEVPVAVAGPPQAAAQVERQVERMRPGAFEIVSVADAAAAEDAIADRDAYGALIPEQGRLLVARAASPAVAELLERAFAEAAPQVQDVRPLDRDDPRGATLNLMMLPLIVVGLPVALLLASFPLRQAAAAAVGFALLAGLAVIGVVQGWVGALPGDYLPMAGVAALLVGAVVLPAAGLVRLLGTAGLGIVALVVLFVGNPGSGAASAPELLPGFWRAVGPLLPPGAGATGLRNVAYFDGAALTTPLLVLSAFALAGLALLLASRRSSPRS